MVGFFRVYPSFSQEGPHRMLRTKPCSTLLALTGALVLCQDALLALRQERAAGRTYELVLCDPPYDAWAMTHLND